MNTPIVVGNTKAYLSKIKDIRDVQEVIWKNLDKESYKYFYCVPDVFLKELSQDKYWAPIFGSQKFDLDRGGANTGATNLEMLENSGSKIVIVGHSEQRDQGEGDDEINQKIIKASVTKIITILCVGEKLRGQEGEHLEFVSSQIKNNLKGIDKKNLDKLIIAYEPVWAIGKSVPATSTQTIESVIQIRRTLVEMFGLQDAKKIKILYGGSVTSEGVARFVKESGVDGVLVGRASTDGKEFAKIINELNRQS